MLFSQDDDSDGGDLDGEKKKSGKKRNKTKKCERNGSSGTDNFAEMEFIDNAVKATKTVKKSKKEKKKGKQK